jgi:hypothetical protein
VSVTLHKLVLILCAAIALAAPACADVYPVAGQWGVSDWSKTGPIDCQKLRVVEFSGEQRTDSGGGVPAYRNNWIRREGQGHYRLADWFTNGQVHNGQVFYELRMLDADRIEMVLDRGGTLRLQRCQ